MKKCKVYPTWVHKNKAYSRFGLYIDYIVRKIIQDIVKNVDFGEESLINDKNWIDRYEDPKVCWQEIAKETLNIFLQLDNSCLNIFVFVLPSH